MTTSRTTLPTECTKPTSVHAQKALSFSKVGAMRVHVYSSTHSHWLQIFTHTLGQSLLFVSLLEAPAKLHDVKIIAMYADASIKMR